ncbi:Phospholipase DDHD1 [Labeo rohita]|uniref:Phospholipase DDHD1 n=1 Tax=Labeo rohita TaxID=84645 RepID=A0ABQ8LYR0_LABRO|nr:Phospholipase DDHD1 [Labeo rohita]
MTSWSLLNDVTEVTPGRDSGWLHQQPVMSSLTKKTRFINNPGNKLSFGNRVWNDAFFSLYDESVGRGMYAVRSDMDRHPSPRDRMTLRLGNHNNPASDVLPRGHLDPCTTPVTSYLHTSNADDCTNPASDYHGKDHLLDFRKTTRSSASRHRFEVITELGPEEVRWFYKEDKKTWKPFMGHDSLRIEIMYRRFCELNPERALNRESRGGEEVPKVDGLDGGEPSLDTSSERFESVDITLEAVCVRGGLYEVDDRIPVMRGQWFIDGTWMPVEEDESDLIEKEHLARFRGQQIQDAFESDTLAKTVDRKDVLSHFPPFYLPFLFKWSGYQTSAKSHKRKRCQAVSVNVMNVVCFPKYHRPAIHSLQLSRSHVDWYSVDEVYLYSDATTSGTRLHRGFVEEASLDDKPPQTTHIVFVVHGIGQKMDKDRIIKNTGMLREAVRKMEEKHFAEQTEEHVEFLPVEWRSKLALDGDTVESITPDKITKGLTQELNRLYCLFCSRNPEFESRGGKVSIISHSLGCVITFDIMTGWDPVRFCLQEHHDQLEGIRPGNTGEQDHIMPKSICRRLFNIFHPTDPVAYRLEPLVLKHYSNITPVQIHWCNTVNPTPYDEIRPTYLNASAASFSKGISEMFFSHFSRSPSLPSAVDSGIGDSEDSQTVTSHTAYWTSNDVALFLLTFIYKQQSTEQTENSNSM